MARTQQGNDQTTNAHKFIMMNILNRLERYGLLIWSVPEGRRLEPHREDVSHAAQGSQGQKRKFQTRFVSLFRRHRHFNHHPLFTDRLFQKRTSPCRKRSEHGKERNERSRYMYTCYWYSRLYLCVPVDLPVHVRVSLHLC